jgi:sulfur carrier protein
MKVRINGKEEEIAGDLTIQGLLAYKNVESPNMVSVELNGSILQRSEFVERKVDEGDAIEFLYFMGGGSQE